MGSNMLQRLFASDLSFLLLVAYVDGHGLGGGCTRRQEIFHQCKQGGSIGVCRAPAVVLPKRHDGVKQDFFAILLVRGIRWGDGHGF